MDYLERYDEWLNSPFVDEESKKELESIRDDDDELKFRFSTVLEFGTGGMRSKMGAGTNMMNVYTVGQVTEGLALLIESLGQDAMERGVIIGRDSRNNSSLFSERAANVLSSHGIKVYLFDDVRPTPELSFGIRYLGCTAGINITASHNPKEYNGYKLYWDDGSQPTAELAGKITGFIDAVDVLSG
ncbi:MAG: phospho-sugar mutase, partial [Oscillospiraceae bacterium]|nr:phospho-sugar mutase [Oscillospiraceae bacterium]